MGLIERFRMAIFPPPASPGYDNFWPYANTATGIYPLTLNQTLLGREEGPPSGYAGLVGWAYQTNAVVYAVEQVRVQHFAEARFEWQAYDGRRFSDASLAILEEPWPNGATADLLSQMLLDADLAGDAFVVRLDNTLARLRPDWTTVITDRDPWIAGSQVIGYAYQPGGPASGLKPVTYLVDQVAQFQISKDPLSPHRGMSWLTPVIREIAADIGMTEHKRAFLLNGATPNLVISLDPAVSKAAFDQWVEAFEKNHTGVRNAYRTAYLGGGAKAEVVGRDLAQLEFKMTQGAGETRIAAAANVPPVIAGLSEGLQAATYSNYNQARRRFADGTMRPAWRNLCDSLQTILTVPGGASLAINDRDIPFLQDDMKERAAIQSSNAAAIRSLTDGGYTPESVIAAVTSNDLGKLVHSGLWSVQLQPPVPDQPEPEPVEPAAEPDQSPDEEKPGRALLQSLEILRSMAEREQPPTEQHFHFPEQAAPVANVTVEAPTITVEAPQVTVEPAPVEVRNEVTVEPAPVAVTVEPTPVTITNEMPHQRTTRKVVRNAQNLITEIVEEPTDG